MIKNYLIIGNPVEHSISPKIHNFWFNENNIKAIYKKETLTESKLENLVQKIKEGDSRTPEGLYTLDWRNPNSKFFRSIHVSYPNLKQSKSAREAGIDPGGEIMIHGQPSNWSERIKLTFKGPDWTEGCIALENQDMIELWNLVPDGTAIKIDP